MAKVLLWLNDPKRAQSLYDMLVAAGHEVVIASTMSNLGPLAKAERQAGTPIQVVIAEVNHEPNCNHALNGVRCAKEINPPARIVALCCCPQSITEAINAGCVAAFLACHDCLLPKAIANITSFI